MTTVVELSRGKWKHILESVGRLDPKILDGRAHPCPSTGEGTDRFRFSNKNNNGNYFCHCSDGKKDGFDLLNCCRSMSFKEAAKEIEELVGKGEVHTDAPRKEHDPVRALRNIKMIQATKGPDMSEVKKYLLNRGITIEPRNVFQASTCYGLRSLGITEPMTAMAATLRDSHGKAETLHLTYIKDGKKADLASPRRVCTPLTGIAGCAVRLAPVEIGLLGIGEGIESSLAASQLDDIPVWATISANGMASFELPKDVNVRGLVIYADNDANFVGQAAAYNLARRLAAKHAGLTIAVRVPLIVGQDFNDVLQGVRL